MSSNNRQPQSNRPGADTHNNGYSSQSLQAIEYLSRIVSKSEEQYLAQLNRIENQEEIANNQNLPNLEIKEDPIARLQNLMGIPPEVKEYQQQIYDLNNQVNILEDKLANTIYLIKQLIPFLSREPSKTRQKIEIFKALQEQLVIDKDTSKIARLVTQSNHQELSISELREQLNTLESQFKHPDKLINSIAPLITQEITAQNQPGNLTKNFAQEIKLNHYQLVKTVAEILTEVVTYKINDDQQALEQAIKPILISTFTEQIQASPTEIAQVITPQIARVIQNQISVDSQAMVSALAPIIDQVVRKNIQQDQSLMTQAVAPIVTPAISQKMQDSPQEFAKAIAPEIADAINEQIRLEEEAMVDALYPIMGSLVTKAITEKISDINDKLENALSREGISRKVRAKVQGVSEAELLLAEQMPFTIRAVFLIKKQSGLVISSQQFGEQKLESEMVAGMLTAIGSFVSEYILSPDKSSEISEIDYGDSQIILEMAGYCYLAVVTDGRPNKQYIEHMRYVFAQIIQDYGQVLEVYEGDSHTIPEQVKCLLASLKENNPKINYQRKRPPALVIIGLVLLSLWGILWGINLYRNWQNYRLVTKVEDAFQASEELAQYNLRVTVEKQNLQLEGVVPQQRLRQQASQISQELVPSLSIQNKIITLESLVDSLLVEVKVKELQAQLNQQPGIAIRAQYQNGQVILEGKAYESSDLSKIEQEFTQLPGVNMVINQLQSKPLALEQKVYFRVNSTQLEPEDINNKIREISRFLKLNPDTNLKIVGFSNPLSESGNNQKIATQRAIAVKKSLESQGIKPQRLAIDTQTTYPPNVGAKDPLWLSRCVTFSLLEIATQ